VQRQIAAFERTWYRANTELRRARRQAEADTDQALDRYIDSLGAPSPMELASFPQSANTPQPPPNPPATGRRPIKNRPPLVLRRLMTTRDATNFRCLWGRLYNLRRMFRAACRPQGGPVRAFEPQTWA
jgi:hypothetical protein